MFDKAEHLQTQAGVLPSLLLRFSFGTVDR